MMSQFLYPFIYLFSLKFEEEGRGHLAFNCDFIFTTQYNIHTPFGLNIFYSLQDMIKDQAIGTFSVQMVMSGRFYCVVNIIFTTQ